MKILKNKNHSNQNIFLINYSNKHYRKSQKINSITALKYGGFSKVISYNPKDIDKAFYLSNKNILTQKRGNGYWLWKPYFIKKTLEQIEWNDYFFYCDSGCYFIDSIQHLINNIDQEIIPFELQLIEKKWTKRDAFILMNCDKSDYYDSKQRLGGYSLWKKTPFTMKFVNEWLELSKDESLITDIENTMGKENYEGFIEHRHDQSIFSLLTKKYELDAHRDPSQFGNYFKDIYKNSNYPQFIVSNRQKNKTLKQGIKRLKHRIKRKIKNWLKT